MSTSVVIPVYGRWDLLHQLLFDLYKNCSLIEEVIIVNNGNEHNNPDVLNGLAWWKSTNMLPIEVLDIPENIGFLKASNVGLKHAVEDRIILISTDVRVHEDIVDYPYMTNSLTGGRHLDWDTGWNTVDGKIYPYIEGWILAAPKTVWERLGYFDERYSPNDMEDVDLSATASSKDIPLDIFPDGYVSHLGAQTIKYGEEREAITKINKKKFEDKWTR
jgi:GT2 family glycosyltransferase